MVFTFYTTYKSVDLVYHEIFRANVGKGGISFMMWYTFYDRILSLS